MFKDEKQERKLSAEDPTPHRAVATEGRLRRAADAYQFKIGTSKAERICDFLAHMAKEVPYVFVPANLTLKATEGEPRLPSDGTEDTKRLRARASGARWLMAEKHKRGLLIHPDGLRATVNDEDTMLTQQAGQVRRLGTAVNSVRKTDAIVNPEKLSPALRQWKQGIRGALKAIDAEQRIFALLPEKKEG
jgi:hypothetical protein